MALLDSEIARIKVELGYNVLTNGASPYIGVTDIFEQVIKPYVGSGAKTTSSTTVQASSDSAPVALTLASTVGFSDGASVSIDVDGRQERATVQSVSGQTIVVMLRKAHSGTYPVTVEGGEAIIREILQRIYDVKSAMADSATYGAGTLKQVDEVHFYETSAGGSYQESLESTLRFWRNELASALGLCARNAPTSQMSVY